jgi:hypothetical protein
MGDRSHVYIEDTGVYLYTHWRGHELPQTVALALSREERWRDPEYLARIIFDEMVGDNDSATGYGIGTEQHGDVYRVVRVDCSEQEITVESGVAPWHDNDEAVSETYSFEEAANARPDWPDR